MIDYWSMHGWTTIEPNKMIQMKYSQAEFATTGGIGPLPTNPGGRNPGLTQVLSPDSS